MLKTRSNGIEIAYERLGLGTPLVLIHGHPLDHSIWDPLLPLLENDFDLIVPDLRGFGQSETIRSRYRLVDMAADIIALLDHLEIQQAAIVGHSMGGYISLACAAVSPSHIRGLGLIASHIFADPPERKSSRYETASEIEKKGVNLLADTFPAKLTADSSLQTILREIILRQSVPGVAESLRAMAERDDSASLVQNARFPMVFIHGTNDVIIPIELAREAKLLADRIHLVELVNAGHMPIMEEPQRTAEALMMLK